MTNPGSQEKAIDTMVIMNTAIINLRLYPATNAMIINTIDRLYETFQAIFEQEESVIFSETESNLLISGEPLSQKHRGKPQVAIFLMLMFNWGIKSLTFLRGMDASELIPFLEIMSKKPDEVKKEGGLEQIISEGKMPHILFNQKIYITKDQDHQFVASLDIKDEDIVKYITSEDPNATLDSQKMKEMAKDPEWVSRIFQSGMQNITGKDGAASSAKLSEGMLHMLRTLDKISENADKEKISHLVAGYISDMDPELIAITLTQNIESFLDNRLFDDIVRRMDVEKFETVAGKIQQALDVVSLANKGTDDPKTASVQQAYQQVMSTDKGIELQRQIQEKRTIEEEEKQQKISYLKEAGSSILSKLEGDIPDESISKYSPGIVQDLFAEGESDTADAIIDGLSNKLLSENNNIRAESSEALAGILEKLPLEQRADILTRLSNKLIEWIQFETSSTLAYKSICNHLSDLAQSQIRNHRFIDSHPIIDTFRLISSDQIKKNEEIKSVASDSIRKIASDDIPAILIDEFRTNKNDKRKEAGRLLVMMAEFSINRLLDMLKESEDSSERILILNLIPEMGPVASRSVIERIDQDAPWYYTRNLARLLGRVGSEGHTKILAQLLVHDDHRVQREVLKSISNIGGGQRGEVLLDALPKCDDLLKSSIVTTLGSLKYRDAVKPLIELFKSKHTLPDDVKIDLQEKICLALGNIGDSEALPFLTEVSKQSGFLSFKSYHQTVKAAAGKAVGRIMSKS